MPGEHDEIKRLLTENLEVTKQNHLLLEKMHRMHLMTFWLKFLWFIIIVGLPLLAFYYVVEPYMAALGMNSEQFQLMLKDLPQLLSSPVGKVMQ